MRVAGALGGVILAMAAVSAKADVVVAQFNGSASNVDLSYKPLPGPGVYRFDLTTSLPVIFVITGGYNYHWDAFVAPPPKPHHEYLEGNNSPTLNGVGGIGADVTWTFVVPETRYVFFPAPAYYDMYGVPEGTPVYQEHRYESPYFSLEAISDEVVFDGDIPIGYAPFDYSFTVSRVTPVPEPAAWALMIVGFAAVGVAVRRRSAALPRAA